MTHDYKALLEQLLRHFYFDDEITDGRLMWSYHEGVGVRDRSSVEFENELKAIMKNLPSVG